MKWLAIIVLIITVFILPYQAIAETTQDITITVSGMVGVGDAPRGFTLTYVSDYEIEISWTPGGVGYYTMVRAAYGHVPDDITDGYEVYYGLGSSTTDDAVSLASLDIVYYRAWSQSPLGLWSVPFATADTGGFMSASIMFMGTIILLITFSVLAFWKESALMFILVAGLALILGLYWYNIYDNNLGLTVSLMILAYSFVSLGYAIKILATRKADKYDD